MADPERAAEGSRHPVLRVGLLLDGWLAPAWVRTVVEEVQASPHAELALVVLRRDPQRRPGLAARLWRHRRHLVYELYARLDRALFRPRPDPFARRDLRPLLEGVPVLEVTPRTTRHSDFVEEADLAEIATHRPDVLLRFGFRILRGGVLTIAPHGVWSYHHDDNREIRGGPPGFWEVMEDHPVTGSMLQVLDERLDGGRIVYRSWAPTHRRSVIRNRAHVYWKSTAFVARCLRALAETGSPAAGDAAREQEAPRPYRNRLYRKPGNVEAAGLLARFAVRGGRDKLVEVMLRRQWFIAWRFHGAPAGEPADEELFRFHVLLPPRDRFWADPFPLFHGGRWWVFFEDFRYKEQRGHVRVLELDPERGALSGTTSEPLGQPALVEPFHLSYPCVFRWNGDIWMVPETAERRQVRLYRSAALPDRWELAAILLDDISAVDATPFEWEGRWWMFVNLRVPRSAHANDELHVFTADTPLGPWQPHPANPVVSDARRARPAGLPFLWHGHLYRPAQDCSRHYGRAVVLHRVLRLDLEEYREEPVTRLPPSWRPGLLGFHTFNRRAGLTVIDGLRRVAPPLLPNSRRSAACGWSVIGP